MAGVGIPSVDGLIEKLKRLPGVGEKGARRFAFFILGQPKDWVEDLSRAIREARWSVRPCSVCGGLAEGDLCPICSDPARDRDVICVVESQEDCVAMERHRIFNGRYHVLGGRYSPLDGEDIPSEALVSLRDRVEREGVQEVILALAPSVEGELTALAVKEALDDLPVKVSRLSSGLPVGGSIGFADSATLKLALEGRRGM